MIRPRRHAALLCAAVTALAAAGAAPAHAADPTLAAAGDIACAPGFTTDANNCHQSGTASLIENAAPAAVATLGDNQYNSATLTEFNGAGTFNDTWGQFKSLIHPSTGNHEYNASSSASGYFSYFGSAAGSGSNGYYSYDLGSWHLVSLNSDCGNSGCVSSGGGVVTTAETNWLQSDLAAHAGMCTLAYWHHPRFDSGQVGDSPGVGPLWTALYADHADVVLNGHDHAYERFARQDPSGNADGNGIREFIVGTGGDDHFPYSGPFEANSEFHDYNDFGALFLTLHPGSYDWQFKRENGTVVDSGTTQCHSQPPAATTSPATSVGPTTATLHGTVNPHGEATTYHFDYGTWTDYGRRSPATDQSAGSDSADHQVSTNLTGLSSSTTYHYRLVATNAAGTTYGSDATFTTAPAPTVQTSPQGNWTGTYGAGGYALGAWDSSADLVSLQNAGLTLVQGYRWRWSSSTSDVRALQSPDASTRRAGAWYHPTDLKLRLNFPSAYSGNLHLYALDWDTHARRETIAVNDGSSTQTVHITSDFHDGAWTSFPINVGAGGTVTIDVTTDAGANAALSGIFLGDAGTPPPVPYQAPPQGNWTGSYGASGWALGAWDGVADLVSLQNAGLTLVQGYRYRWSASTSDARALQSSDGSTRRAAAWYHPTDLKLRLNFPSAYSGNLHLYALDWDSRARRETITVNDGSGAQTIHVNSDFHEGAWAGFPISVGAGGSVTIDVTTDAGQNAVLSGLFLGGGGTPPAAPYQTPPQGTWRGTYGANGYELGGFNDPTFTTSTSGDATSLPAGASLTIAQGNTYGWTLSTSEVRALESPDGSQRRAACWYDTTNLRLQLNFALGYSGTLSLYAVDWTSHVRRETITVGDGSVTQTVHLNSDFYQGAWTRFPINVPPGGTVTINVTTDGGQNAVLSGLFLD